ncbi:MAG: cytochrome c3 family protein [Anaerolineae bacterium]
MRLAVSVAAAALLLIILVGPGVAVLGDIVFQRKGGGAGETPPALFSHWLHRIRFKCYVCHDAIFQMKAGGNPVTMDAIREGKFCGTCHDGQTAFPVRFETCSRCHRE